MNDSASTSSASSGDRPEEVDLLIEGCDIVSLDSEDTVVRNGVIAVKGQHIAWIGKASDSIGRFCPKAKLDGSEKIALPGMIDAHFHTAQQLLRGKLAEIARRRQLRNPVWKCYYIPFESILEPEDIYLSGLVAVNDRGTGTPYFRAKGTPVWGTTVSARSGGAGRGCTA